MFKKIMLKIGMASLICFVIGSLVISNADEKNSKLFIKGMLMEKADVFTEDGRTFLPLRLVGEGLGYEVAYHGATKGIEIKNDKMKISMKIGDKKAVVNGENKSMDVMPVLKDSKICVPTRFVAESFGEKVEWDAKNKVVIVSQYPEPNLKIAEPQEFKMKDLRFSLQLSEKFKENISYEEKEDVVIFFDIYNKEKSKDKASGALCFISKSTHPASKYVPSVLLGYQDGVYVEAVQESGVEYSLENKEFKNRYDESMKLLVESLKTFQMK